MVNKVNGKLEKLNERNSGKMAQNYWIYEAMSV